MARYEHTCSALKSEEHKNKDCAECQRQTSIGCTCPDWWFPPDRRVELRKLAHGLGGVLQHHNDCAKRG